MKRAFIYTIFLLTAGLFFTELKAQEVYLGEVKIIQNRFEQRGDSVYIEMNVNLNGLPGKKPINGRWLSITDTPLSRFTRRLSLINGAGRELPITWLFLMRRG